MLMLFGQAIASSYVSQWQTLATSADGTHLTIAVSSYQSHPSFLLSYTMSNVVWEFV